MTGGMTSVDVIVNRILIVEGDQSEADFLKSFLQSKKFDVDWARDAGQARSAFGMHQPDFVILEAILPNAVSGFELCDRMKRDNNAVPILMLTAIDMDDARDLASRVGADAYMTKPYDPAELLDRIRAIAEAAWARKHLGDSAGGGSEDKVRFSCTECGKHLKAKSSHRGRTLTCPKCGQAVMIPLYS